MKQMSLSESGFERKTKRTRKREFLDEMNLVVPWAELVALIAPHAPARGTKGGPSAISRADDAAHPFLACMDPTPFASHFFVMFNGLHTCIRLADGQSPMHARSLDEIRAFRPWQQFGLSVQPTESTGSRNAGLTSCVITFKRLRKPVWVFSLFLVFWNLVATTPQPSRGISWSRDSTLPE
jgi:hypothetical protein